MNTPSSFVAKMPTGPKFKTPSRPRKRSSAPSSARTLALTLVLAAAAQLTALPYAKGQATSTPLSSQPRLTAQAQCTDIDLSRPGGSMHCQPIYNQSLPESTVPDASLCDAIAATEVWDAYRWNERESSTADCATFDTSSPVRSAALETLTNPSSSQELAWGFEHITFNAMAFHGGCRARVFQSNPSDAWAAAVTSGAPGVLWQNEQWQQTPNYGVNHAAVIVARTWRDGECQFRIRDSYGQDRHSLGEFWVRESILANWLARVGEIQN
jgi:hypothetical protein